MSLDDNTLTVTINLGHLRTLIREEIQAVMAFTSEWMKARRMLAYHGSKLFRVNIFSAKDPTRKNRTVRNLPSGKPERQEEHSAQVAEDDSSQIDAEELLQPERPDPIDPPTESDLDATAIAKMLCRKFGRQVRERFSALPASQRGTFVAHVGMHTGNLLNELEGKLGM